MRDLPWALPFPHCGSQSSSTLPEESPQEFEVNKNKKRLGRWPVMPVSQKFNAGQRANRLTKHRHFVRVQGVRFPV